jgi:hypothetical protein
MPTGKIFAFKGIPVVSRDWGGLLMISMKRYKVVDMPAS